MVAARRRGFTLGPCACVEGVGPWGCGCGVLAPVATGVVRLEGSSEVKIVALEGEIRYLADKVARRASLNPVQSEHISKEDGSRD